MIGRAFMRGGRVFTRINPEARDQLAISLIKELSADWTPTYMDLLIQSDTVPKKHIDIILQFLSKHPELATIQKEEFLAATKVARPDIYPKLLTRNGDAWLEHAMADLGKSLIGGVVGFFLGGR